MLYILGLTGILLNMGRPEIPAYYREVIMKKLCAVTLLALSTFANMAQASNNGFSGFQWGDTVASVAQKNNAMQNVPYASTGDNKTMTGTPKEGKLGFLGIRADSPYQYNFFKGELFSISVTLKMYPNGKAETVAKAKADYEEMKEKMAKSLGVNPELTESADPSKPFFACIYDDKCGVYGANFTTSDSNITLFMTGSENGNGNELMVSVNQK